MTAQLSSGKHDEGLPHRAALHANRLSRSERAATTTIASATTVVVAATVVAVTIILVTAAASTAEELAVDGHGHGHGGADVPADPTDPRTAPRPGRRGAPRNGLPRTAEVPA